ncbi:Cdc6/Cdc18 family protein [Natronoglomus mannanivorans]|uniref:AAA family ATPase n=1 Tax=Natronoglomus mannanivorans TaxID=2979990 RepID=A0AAP2Z1D5_9EURY|nr:AAA family ATPase [Halobacteria archaeon AArc-xg1-1]
MITHQWVFDDSYPSTILHRHSEIKQLSRSLEPAIHGNRPDDVLIYGPSGVGKTSTMQAVLRDMKQRASLNSATIECSGSTRWQILDEAVSKHPADTAVMSNTPREVLVELLEKITTEPYIVVLDEADIIPDLNVLSDLFSAENVSVVAIAHDKTEWLHRLDDDVAANFPADSQIEFEKYHQEEVVDILKPRAREGLEPGAANIGQFEWIADETAGVARYAIKSLLAAAELAEERNHDRLHERDVDDSFERARSKIRKDNLQSLPPVYHRMYELARRLEQPVAASVLKDAYQRNQEAIAGSAKPVSWRRARDYLAKMVDYKLITAPGVTQSKKYEVVDPDLEAPTDVEFDLEKSGLAD